MNDLSKLLLLIMGTAISAKAACVLVLLIKNLLESKEDKLEEKSKE